MRVLRVGETPNRDKIFESRAVKDNITSKYSYHKRIDRGNWAIRNAIAVTRLSRDITRYIIYD